MSTERITLNDNGEVIEQDTANVLNVLFFNIVTNLKISEYTDYNPVPNIINDSILKVFVRYSILTNRRGMQKVT